MKTTMNGDDTLARPMWSSSRAIRLAGLAASCALLAVGCGSSSKSATDSSSVVTVATTTASSASSTVGSSGVSVSADTSGVNSVTAAAEFIAPYLKTPTLIGDTTPLPMAPSKDETIVVITCDTPECQQVTDAIEESSKTLGWTVKNLAWSIADSTTLLSGLDSALQLDPLAVLFVGPGQSVWNSAVAKYEAAGVFLIPAGTGPVTFSKNLPVQVDDVADLELQGKMLAQRFISESQGTGNVLVADVTALGGPSVQGHAFIDAVKADCADCKVTVLPLSITDWVTNGGVPAQVSALQRDPSIKWVMAETGSMAAGLPAALSGASIDDVRIVVTNPNAQTLQQVADGKVDATAWVPFSIMGAMQVHVAAQVAVGLTPKSGLMPAWLLTKDNIGDPTKLADQPADYVAQYERLWQVG